MKKMIAVGILGLVAAFAGCKDSATEITGTLPIVTGVAIDSVSVGDTIVITWTAMDTTIVDGYYLWTRNLLEGPWTLVDTYENNAGAHIAKRSAFYTVMAYKDDDKSKDNSLSVNTKTENLSEIREVFSFAPVGFRIDVEGDSLMAGDPADSLFAQHFTIAADSLGNRFVFPGSAYSDVWPGGVATRISSIEGYIAPAPNDTTSWMDIVSYDDNFFIALDSGHYCRLQGTSTLPDTLTLSDTLVISGQIQPLMGVRVFNELL